MNRSEQVRGLIGDLLAGTSFFQDEAATDIAGALHLSMLEADGSSRCFFRVCAADGNPLCVGVLPASNDAAGLAEAHAAMAIGRHLARKGAAVPRILAADERCGLILFEDCGDRSLYDAVVDSGGGSGEEWQERLFLLYAGVLGELASLQVRGSEGFRQSWCHDTGEYDQDLMIRRESRYFYEAFWRDWLGGAEMAGIDEEFADIAAHAADGPWSFFLHRDFQSRNILLPGGDRPKVKCIDFQGGRIGPPGYDLASLLIDPYVGLPPGLQERLMDHYLGILGTLTELDAGVFRRQYGFLKLQRNLQILGAFAFLSQRRGKPFFQRYLRPSLAMLLSQLGESRLRPYGRLRTLAGEADRLLRSALPDT